MKIPRRVAVLMAGAVFAGTLAACGSSDDSAAATYTPAAYWQSVNNVRECYYVQDAQEAYNLMAAGLCPVGSIPTPMALSWEEAYWDYYSSPAYYNTYVPVSYRTRYRSVTVVHFSTTYRTQIKTASAKAVYKSSAGGTVTGSKVNTKQFGSGSRSTTSYGGGSRGGSGSGSSSSRSSGYSGSRSAGRH
jgi:uncharacterized membrane protein YgcG